MISTLIFSLFILCNFGCSWPVRLSSVLFVGSSPKNKDDNRFDGSDPILVDTSRKSNKILAGCEDAVQAVKTQTKNHADQTLHRTFRDRGSDS